MRAIRLKKTVTDDKGSIEAGSIYNYNKKSGMYEYEQNGNVISIVDESAIKTFPHLFEEVGKFK